MVFELAHVSNAKRALSYNFYCQKHPWIDLLNFEGHFNI